MITGSERFSSMDKKKPISLSWDDFQSLGNPENAPETPDSREEKTEEVNIKSKIRIYKERKQRGGKSVSVVKGLEAGDDYLKNLTKALKVKLGVGGYLEDSDIIIQGTNREKIKEILIKKGFQDIKLAGS